jgi:glycosyltransferase involved in cell wall biosynthesis
VISSNADDTFEVIVVNDGSTDATLERLLEAQKRFGYLVIIDFARNFGKEAAITAGLDRAKGDAIIPMDGDLQHPPELIPTLVAKWREGYEVVLAQRENRETDGEIQRLASRWFYGLIRNISTTPIPSDVGDFRLIDRMVADALIRMRETHRFMKGLFAWVGFRTTTITFVVAPRPVGQSQFNFWKRWNFALEGITSFSTVPIRIWTYIGSAIATLSIVYGIYETVKTILYGVDVPGYASLMTILLFSCGIQLIGLGLIGEYVGRIFIESKQRPVYIVRRTYRNDQEPRW